MNNENTKKLFRRYKFLNKKNISDGFQCGDGWFSIVNDMCKKMKASSPPNDFIITRIIEKYGGLRVHTKNGTMQTRVAINEAIYDAFEICDECVNDKILEKCDKCTTPEIEYPDEEESESENGCGNCSSGCSSP